MTQTAPDSATAVDTPTLVAALANQLRARGWMMATAESCTGGMIAAACTDLAGSSAWFERGIVSYSNAAKIELLGVPAELIARHGAVSEAVARAMASSSARTRSAGKRVGSNLACVGTTPRCRSNGSSVTQYIVVSVDARWTVVELAGSTKKSPAPHLSSRPFTIETPLPEIT